MIILVIIIFLVINSSYVNKIKKVKEYKGHSFPVKVQISENSSETDSSPEQLIVTYNIDGEVIRGTLDSEFRYSRSQIRRLLFRKRETEIYVNMMNKKKFIVPDIYRNDLLLKSTILGYLFIYTLIAYGLFITWHFFEFEFNDWLIEKMDNFFTFR